MNMNAVNSTVAALVLACALAAQGCASESAGNPAASDPDAGGLSGQAGDCKPLTCAEVGAECGAAADGCGGVVHCGECSGAERCGGGGPNKCGQEPCTPKTCAQLDASCGQAHDTCDTVLSCGTCPSGQTCGGAGPNKCGQEPCTPKTCTQLGVWCGQADDSCGTLLWCGTCPPDAGPSQPCDSVTCSGHGTCSASGANASCTCDAGYHAVGLECLLDAAGAGTIPGTIQAEDFDNGGEGVAYHDAEPANLCDANYRPGEGVDIKTCSDTGGGYAVGWTVAGEWLNYTVNVTVGGPYTLEARVATSENGKSFHVEIDGTNVTGGLTAPVTGPWDTTWASVTKSGLSLTQGQHVMKVVFDTGTMDLNFLKLIQGGTDPCANVTCSGHGSCAVSGGNASCTCASGYQASGLDCVPTSTTGAFHVENGRIMDPDGHPFVARGINLNASQMSTVSTGSDGAPLTTLFPGINFVRLPNEGSYQSPSYYQAFIAQLSALRIVVEIEDHPWPLVAPYTGSALTAETSWYASLAAAFQDNPYVWFGTMNEPQTGYGAPEAAISTQEVAIYDAIRGAGSNTIVMMSVMGGGNPGTVGAGFGMTASSYAAMTNIVWDLHQYGWMSNYSTDQATVSGYLSGSVNGGYGVAAAQTIPSADGLVPVIIGEFGDSTTGQQIDPNGDQVITAVTGSGHGWAAWAWAASTNPGDLLVSNGGLTPYGQRIAAAIASP